MRPFAPAVVLALAIIATSPFMGLIRDALFRWVGPNLPQVLAVVLGLAAAIVVLWVVARVRGDADRERRRRRFLLLAAVALLLVLQAVGFSTDDLRVDVVEKIHIFEYGALALLLYRGVRRSPDLGRAELLVVPVLAGTLAGVLDEATQGFFQLRTGDIRDVGLNAIASFCGLLLALALDPPSTPPPSAPGRHEEPAAKERGGNRLRASGLAGLAAVLVLAVGLFFAHFHLGYEIDDPELGRFRSWFTAEHLAELQLERAERWTREPPTGLVAWNKEDYYLTEAAWHANHRNERQRSGDAYMALAANRILEEYYAPFLELESFRGSGRHRWGPGLVAELEAQLDREYGASGPPPMAGFYVSPVLRKRIHAWPPKGPFLAGVGVLAFVICLLGLGIDRRRRA